MTPLGQSAACANASRDAIEAAIEAPTKSRRLSMTIS
jgi:hypothetical protein